jgi:serine/threonine protein kinase
MADFTQDYLRDLMSKWLEPERIPKRFRIITDTTDFYRVDYDDVAIFEDRPYLIRNVEKEGRFGIDEQPKFWVKRAIDLITGETKIIKLVFWERFTAKVGGISFECFRSPKKEARILELVKGHPNFMQGFSVEDSVGNLIRIIDYIKGKTLSDIVFSIKKSHEEYFHDDLPSLLKSYAEIIDAVRFLHNHGEKHGDIRRDHILKDSKTGDYKWIDFDFNYYHGENKFGYDLFGLGNILIFLVGGGDVTIQGLADRPDILDLINENDTNIVFHNRVANLKKVYPYIPDELNYMLLHFSNGANVFYESTDELFSDMQKAINKIC